MGLIDDIAAEYTNDSELARVYEQSYLEGIHSAWSIALIAASATEQNLPANGDVMKMQVDVEFQPLIISTTTRSSKLKQAFAPA